MAGGKEGTEEALAQATLPSRWALGNQRRKKAGGEGGKSWQAATAAFSLLDRM